MPTQLPSEVASDTKTALLDAAERLFAARGIDATSLRAITSNAGANLASVNYHFGSKEGLVRAVFARRLRPLNQQRLELLGRCTGNERRAPRLRQILDAFVSPVLTMMRSDEAGNREFVQLMGRALANPDGDLRSLLLQEFSEVIERFTAALSRALPKLPPVEIAWRFHFMVGAMAYTIAASELLRSRLEDLGIYDFDDISAIQERLVTFLESGWRGATPQSAAQGTGRR